MRTLLGFGSDLVGAAEDAGVPGASSAAALVKPEPASVSVRLKKIASHGGAGLLGGGVGYMVYKQHPVLGALVGASAGMNASGLMDPMKRQKSVAGLIGDAAAVAGSKLYKKHPVIGFILGAVVGSVGGEYVTEMDSVKRLIGV